MAEDENRTNCNDGPAWATPEEAARAVEEAAREHGWKGEMPPWQYLVHQIRHARAALRHVSRTCLFCDLVDLAQFTHRASLCPPSAFAPKEDYAADRPED